MTGRGPGITIPSIVTPAGTFSGHSPTFTPVVRVAGRELNARAIRSELADPPRLIRDVLLDDIDDDSGSMRTQHDTCRFRREATLVACEHLAGRRVRRGDGRWHARLTTFDRNSPMELSTIALDRRGLATVERALLSSTPGGSSNLGPALRHTNQLPFDGRRLIVVQSDFELYDPEGVSVIIRELDASPADAILALVFTALPPPSFTGTRIAVVHVDPAIHTPTDIARHIVDFAIHFVQTDETSSEET